MFCLKIKIKYSEDLSDSLTQAVNDDVRKVIQASGEDYSPHQHHHTENHYQQQSAIFFR